MTTPAISQCIGMNTFQTYLNNKVDGSPLASGTVTFYSDINRTSLKTVYQITGSPGSYSLIAIPNPNTLNADGTLSDGSGGRVIPYFYPFDVNGGSEAYYITVYDSGSVLQETLENFPPSSSGSSSGASNSLQNYVQNGQFLIWDHEPVAYGSGSPPSGQTVITTYLTADTFEQICDGWYFQRNASTTTDNFSQQAFAAGQTTVESNPRYYLKYQCTAANGETYKRIVNVFPHGAAFLEGQTVTFSIQAQADTARNIYIQWGQNFGSTGSTQVISSILATIPVGSNWNKSIVQFNIPSISGKTLSSAYDDFAFLLIGMDINVAATYSFANVQLTSGILNNPTFPTLTYAQFLDQMDPWWKIATGQYAFMAKGDALDIYDRWLPMNDTTIGNPNSGADNKGLKYFNLFVYLWTTYAVGQCPVYNNGGTPVSRGTDAVADWNASYRIRLPLSMSRLIGNAGNGAGLTNRVPGVTGGAETSTALIAHSHTFTNNGGTGTNYLPASSQPYNGDAIGLGTGTTGYSPHVNASPAAVITSLSATDTTGSGSSFSIMNPFSFLQLYIHI